MADTQIDITVVGGGVVGLACARFLAMDGATVRVVDAGDPRFGTSLGNAGWIAPSHVIPFAAPGMVSLGIEQFLKRTGAFGMSLSAGPQLVPWLTKFMRSCTREHVERYAPALAELLERNVQIVNELTESAGLLRTGNPHWVLYSSQYAETLAKSEYESMSRFDVKTRLIDRWEARDLEPIITEEVKAVLEIIDDFGIDPLQLVSILREECSSLGVEFRSNEAVTGLDHRDAYVSITTSMEAWKSEWVVLAAGVWSREVANMVGGNLRIIPAKGHSVTIEHLRNVPTRTLMLAEQRIATTPIGHGLRMSTGYSLASTADRSVDQKRIEKMISKARRVLDLPESIKEVRPWTGLRPASPDGIPYIGALPAAPRVIAATGHGMLGVMMSLGTGSLVADIVAGRPISHQGVKFSPSR